MLLQTPAAAAMDNQARLRAGNVFLSFVWFQVARSVVETAVRVYGCTPAQAAALRAVFLRPNDYTVLAA